MKKKSWGPVVVVILGFALLGIANNPWSFITSIFLAIGFIAILYFVFTKFLQPRMMGGRDQAPYRAAVAAQKQPPTKKKPTSLKAKQKERKKNSQSKPIMRRQSDVKLTVIEGKKNKKKSRALF
ncbi:hypothetical protein FLK61_29945 [Paenalkalicoccus suaedae]|uniref:Uncharacterized protein n=1 Tax=Paenalkalicoccus suaedae TaxID=2592382 RepID=A0A859FD06_9BACI|nr:SA1362 family protein [Paenalkalicoccus suaedae]QKS70947.1 hypothetical protein FLK61_29945 [Paenalkalicoccus suaedae]